MRFLLAVILTVCFSIQAAAFDVKPPYCNRLHPTKWGIAELRSSIYSSLERRGVESRFATELLTATAVTESDLGRILRQLPQGPARGLFQIEKQTMRRIVMLAQKAKNKSPLQEYVVLRSANADISYLARHDFDFQVAASYLLYDMRGVEMSKGLYTIEDIARIWKRVWNTHLGKGTTEYFIRKYNDAVETAEGR